MTDAGFEMIDYSVAVKYFSLEEIIDYWESVIDFSDIDNEEELEKFEKLISINYFSVSEINSQEFMQNLSEQFSWIPPLVDVVMAKAVYGIKHKWIKVIALLPRTDGEYYIDSFETEAIWLGLALKKEMNESDLSVINDNQWAVSHINSILSENRTSFQENEKSNQEHQPEVFWSPRNFVSQADRLKIREATKIFAPDVEFDIE